MFISIHSIVYICIFYFFPSFFQVFFYKKMKKFVDEKKTDVEGEWVGYRKTDSDAPVYQK